MPLTTMCSHIQPILLVPIYQHWKFHHVECKRAIISPVSFYELLHRWDLSCVLQEISIRLLARQIGKVDRQIPITIYLVGARVSWSHQLDQRSVRDISHLWCEMLYRRFMFSACRAETELTSRHFLEDSYELSWPPTRILDARPHEHKFMALNQPVWW